jgi:hypothetical protein
MSRTSRLRNFKRELTTLLNSYSFENDSNTPDFILARYLLNCLNAWNDAVMERETWHGRTTPAIATTAPDERQDA